MRIAGAILTLLLATMTAGRGVPRNEVCAPPADFKSSVQPILEQHCKPCHFTGGKMYEKLPFDRAETITKLGEKLFTRIKNEQERATISEFLRSQRARR